VGVRRVWMLVEGGMIFYAADEVLCGDEILRGRCIFYAVYDFYAALMDPLFSTQS
jgi:hypothetical protein